MENEITQLYIDMSMFVTGCFYSLLCSEGRILAELASRVTIRITLIHMYILRKTYNNEISCFV